MKQQQRILFSALIIFAVVKLIAVAQPSNFIRQVTPPNVTGYSNITYALPNAVIAWDSLMKSVDASNGQDIAKFNFIFTNLTASTLTILDVHPSCGCTTAELPPVPWLISANGTGEIKLSVNLQGKSGTLFKSVNVATDNGSKSLILKINILSPGMLTVGDDRRAIGIAAARADRQAVFKGDCVTCHVKNVQGKFGQQLYEITCSICHEATHRAGMVPDLHNLPVPTNEDFWRSWITSGKADTLMPAFATSQGGPLDEMQIASLAAYLNSVNPSRVKLTGDK